MVLKFEIRARSKQSLINTLKEIAKYNNIELIEKNINNAILKYGISDFMMKPMKISFGKTSTYDQAFYRELSINNNCIISVYDDSHEEFYIYNKDELKISSDNLIHEIGFR